MVTGSVCLGFLGTGVYKFLHHSGTCSLNLSHWTAHLPYFGMPLLRMVCFLFSPFFFDLVMSNFLSKTIKCWFWFSRKKKANLPQSLWFWWDCLMSFNRIRTCGLCIRAAPDVWFFIAQLVEHCSSNAEGMGSNPVKAPKTFFGLNLWLLKAQ